MAGLRRLALFLGALLPAVLAAPTAAAKKPEVIPGKYIVTLKEGATDTESHINWVNDIHRRSLGKRDTAGVEKTYNISSWNAYSGEFDDETIKQIKANPEVCYYSNLGFDKAMVLMNDCRLPMSSLTMSCISMILPPRSTSVL